MGNINPKWMDINVFCIVSMSEVLIVPLWPADKESFSDLLQIFWSQCPVRQKMSREKLSINEMFVVFPTTGPFMMQWSHHNSPMFSLFCILPAQAECSAATDIIWWWIRCIPDSLNAFLWNWCHYFQTIIPFQNIIRNTSMKTICIISPFCVKLG